MTLPGQCRNAHILLVEDDRIDVEAARRALKQASIGNPVAVAQDGIEALEFLKGENGREKLPQPCIVLLDINLPRMNGFEFLQALRGDDHARRNVVFMLTTSAREADKKLAYDLSAAGYITKDNVAGLAAMLQEYCKVNEFPAA